MIERLQWKTAVSSPVGRVVVGFSQGATIAVAWGAAMTLTSARRVTQLMRVVRICIPSLRAEARPVDALGDDIVYADFARARAESAPVLPWGGFKGEAPLRPPMRLTTLGTAAAGVPRSGDSGSGHLVEHVGTAGSAEDQAASQRGVTRILVDAGGGVLGALAAVAPLESLSAVFLTHLHNDHVADLYPIALWARFTHRKLSLYGPPGTRTLLYKWFSLFASDPDPYVQALEIVECEDWRAYTIGALKVTTCPVEHNVLCHALRIEAGGRRLVISADTRAGALIEEAAQGADLLLSEATYQDLPPGREPEKSRAHHMTAREAGALARKAGARRLVLTHLKFDLDPEVSRKQAEEAYGAPVELASPGASFDV